uniref:ER membrane protein complex subunit 4 n=1 Tax=Microcebus murinus TaxID=30608 RepID=A0A8C5Y663_MICMU
MLSAQGSLVANRGRRFQWAIELSGPGGGSRGRNSLYPVGYLDKQVPDTSVQETDCILVEKRYGASLLHPDMVEDMNKLPWDTKVLNSFTRAPPSAPKYLLKA